MPQAQSSEFPLPEVSSLQFLLSRLSWLPGMTYYHFTDQVRYESQTHSSPSPTQWRPSGSLQRALPNSQREDREIKHSNYREAKESGLQSLSRLSSVASRSCSFPPATRESLPAAPTGCHRSTAAFPAQVRPSSKVSICRDVGDTFSQPTPGNSIFKHLWSRLGRQSPLLWPLKATDPPRADVLSEGITFPASGNQEQQRPGYHGRCCPSGRTMASSSLVPHCPHSITD